MKKRFSSSITIEASLILSFVLLSMVSLIRYAYRLHDTVTGSMILEESMEKAATNVDPEKDMSYFEAEGSEKGNPRLFLGTYEVELDAKLFSLTGEAKAGDWSVQIERKEIHPETFLRQQDAAGKLKDKAVGE